MKKRSTLSKKMVGVVAAALTVTPVAAVQATLAVVETPLTILVEKNGISEPINLELYFPSGLTTYSVTNQTYSHSSFMISGNSLTISGNGTVPYSNNYTNNRDEIGIHATINGVDTTRLFSVQVVSKPTIKVQLPALTMKHNQPKTINLTEYFADEDNNINNNYSLASGLPTSGYPTDTYAFISGSYLTIHSGTQPITTNIAVTARDDNYKNNALTSHSVTNSFNLAVEANSAPVSVSSLSGKTLDAEVGGLHIILPKLQLFTDADGDPLSYSVNGNYSANSALSFSGLFCGDQIDIAANMLGTYSVTMAVDDQYGGKNALSFSVNVHPKLSHNIIGPPVLPISATLSVRSSFAGTVYLVPSTEKVLTKTQFDNLVASGKASNAAVTANSYANITTLLPVGAYKLYLEAGNTIYTSSTGGIIIYSNDLMGDLAISTTDPKIDIGSILRYLNKPSNNSLKDKFDSTYLRTLLELITPIADVQVLH